MATQSKTQPSKSFTCPIKLVSGRLDITVPKKGARETTVVNVPLERAFALQLNDEQATLLNGLENEVTVENKATVDLTVADMLVLKSILDQLQALKDSGTSALEATTAAALHGGIGGSIHHAKGNVDAHNIGEYRVTRAMNVLANLEDEYWDLQYDIPEGYDEYGESLDGVVANPSKWMWQYGCRKTWSVWILPKSKYFSKEIQDWITKCKEAGVRIRVNRWHPEDISLIKDLAIEELDKEVRRLHTGLINALSKADAALAKVMEKEDVTEKEADAAERCGQNTYKTAIRRSVNYLNNAIKSAELFDVTMEVTDLFLAVRDAIQSEYEAVNARLMKSGRQPMRLAF